MNGVCAALLPEILDKLKQLHPERVILFGSNALDAAQSDSDIDLVVVLDTDEIPSTYDRKIELKLRVRQCLKEINLQAPIDLLVYTRPEYDALIAQGSSFSREIQQTGRVLYAKAS